MQTVKKEHISHRLWSCIWTTASGLSARRETWSSGTAQYIESAGGARAADTRCTGTNVVVVVVVVAQEQFSDAYSNNQENKQTKRREAETTCGIPRAAKPLGRSLLSLRVNGHA